MEEIDRQGNVGGASHRERLAIVKAFQLRKLFEMLLDQVAQLPDEAAAVGRGHLRPRASFKRLARGLHGAIDIFAIALGDLGHDLAGGGVVNGKRLAGSRFHPLAVDEQLARRADEFLHATMNLRSTCGSGHNTSRSERADFNAKSPGLPQS